MNDRQINGLDILAYFSFFMSLLNYKEIIDNDSVQDTIHFAIKDIHEHLKSQDEKIDEILTKLGGKDER